MTRIVTYAHRYKRPPRKRKAAALELPAVVRKSKFAPRTAAVGAGIRGARVRSGDGWLSLHPNFVCGSVCVT
jgi:hypothetical protein